MLFSLFFIEAIMVKESLGEVKYQHDTLVHADALAVHLCSLCVFHDLFWFYETISNKHRPAMQSPMH